MAEQLRVCVGSKGVKNILLKFDFLKNPKTIISGDNIFGQFAIENDNRS